MRTRGCVVGLVAAALLLGNVATAAAVDLYVDNSGSDTTTCTVPATPCLTIQFALNQAGTSDVVHIGGGTYMGTVTVNGNDSLIEDQAFVPAAAGEAILSNVATSQNTVTMNSTGTISGLTIRGNGNAIEILAAATISGNLFDDTTNGGQYGAEVVVDPDGGTFSPTITGNTFDDPMPTDQQVGLVLNAAGSPIVSANSFDGYWNGIFALTTTATTPTISNNTITGTHQQGTFGTGILLFNGAEATLIANHIHSPGTGNSDAVLVQQTDMANVATATMRRNRIFGHISGVTATGNTVPVTLDSDLIAKTMTGGLVLSQSVTNFGVGAEVTNATIIDTAMSSDILVGAGTSLDLDSSIVGAGTAPSGVSGGAALACTVSFSRGSGSGACNQPGFVSSADPMFVNPAGNDYHLLGGSPMIDAGNPAAPGPGALDIDAEIRASTGVPCTAGAGRRDIGADEAVPPPCPMTTTPEPAKKKCKKKKKKGKKNAGAAAKKKKCKKKKKKKR